MANYYGTGRSNYVKVKDREAFDTFIEELRAFDVVEADDTVALLAIDAYGGIPDYRYEGDEEVEIDFLDEISKHLVEEDGNIFVYQSVGHEKMRYVSGYTCAVDHHGKTLWYDLNQIYLDAKKSLGFTPATRATY